MTSIVRMYLHLYRFTPSVRLILHRVWKTLWMMKAMMGYHDESQKAVAQGVSWGKIREATKDIAFKLRSMKFEVCSRPPSFFFAFPLLTNIYLYVLKVT